MPVYEYRCNNCHRKLSVYVRDFSQPPNAACSFCGSHELSRLFSSFAIRKTYMAAYEGILSDDRLVKGLEQNDPRALAEWSKRMSGETGEDLQPEYQDMMQRMESGEMPPELMGGGQSAGDSEE